MPSTTIGTWIHLDSRAESSHFYQMRGTSHSRTFQATYWKSVCVFFATSVRMNPDAEHILFTNALDVPDEAALPVRRVLTRLGVRIEIVQMTRLPSAEYAPAWRNQFYVFDIIRRLSSVFADDDVALVFDADCVWIDTARRMVASTRKEGALTYVLPYPPSYDINGITRVEMKEIFEDLSGEAREDPPTYFGGEILAATGRELMRINSAFNDIWTRMQDRFEKGASYLTEEAHVLSYIYDHLGYAPGTANAVIKRIWTGLPFQMNTASLMDFGLSVWHLPLEKRYGIPRIFEDVIRDDSVLQKFAESTYRSYLGTRLGVPQRTPGKLIADSAAWIRGRRH